MHHVILKVESLQPQILEYTRELLPAYMVPNDVERIAEFPLTPNEKADRNALIQLRLETLQGKSSVHGHTSRDKRAMLQGIWRDLLNVPNVQLESLSQSKSVQRASCT